MNLSEVLKMKKEKQAELAGIEHNYKTDKARIAKEMSEIEYKENYLMEGLGAAGLLEARDNVRIYQPEVIITSLAMYLRELKSVLIEDYNKLRTHNLEIQDNAYGNDHTRYTSMVKKGYGTDYHPMLGAIIFSPETSDEVFELLLLELNKVDLSKTQVVKDQYRMVDIGFSKEYMSSAFKVKNPELINLLFTLGFPNKLEFSFYNPFINATYTYNEETTSFEFSDYKRR